MARTSRARRSRFGNSAHRQALTSGRRLLVEPLEERRLLSLTAQLVADINPVLLGQGGSPSNFCQVGSLVYFTANTPTTGTRALEVGRHGRRHRPGQGHLPGTRQLESRGI